MEEAVTPVCIVWSSLAVEQMAGLPEVIGEAFLDVLGRLAPFSERFPRLPFPGLEAYRQIVRGRHRLVYRYFPADRMVRIYVVQASWRTIPAEEFLRHLQF